MLRALGQFHPALKTHLFLNRVGHLVTLAFSAPYKCPYLLTNLLTEQAFLLINCGHSKQLCHTGSHY